MGEATVDRREAHVELNAEEVRQLIVVSQNASVIELFGREVDFVSSGETQVFINGRLQMMWLKHVVSSCDVVGYAVLIDSEEPASAVVLDVAHGELRPRQMVYSYTLGEDEAPGVKHFL